jgi:predicted MFS family arabinose efflux permease
VYLVRTLGASPEEVGGLAAVDGTSAVVGQALAGVLAVRFGSRRILVGSLAVIPALPLIWWLIDSPLQAAIPNSVGGGAWAFYNLAIFNVVLELAPRGNVPRYAAAQQAAVQLASFVGPLVGTAVVATWGVRTAFLVSGFGRMLALTILVWPSGNSRGRG